MQDFVLGIIAVADATKSSQLDRHLKRLGIERIVMLAGDIKDSGDIEQDMDIELLIYRDDVQPRITTKRLDGNQCR